MNISNNIIFILLAILGGLGLFLFGMRLTSESLQKLTGQRLRSFLNTLVSKKGKSFFTGLGLTGLIQSSSATSVMTVSFVSTGLVSFSAALPIILGANIGTTLKFWFISYLGFSFDFTVLLLPLIGLSFPLIFSRKSRYRSLGEFILGFSIMFLGIFFIKQAVPDVSNSTWVYEWVNSFGGYGFFSVLLFVFFGMLLTSVIQSSSASMTLTVILAYKGFIDYQFAMAMILGENIGTTITALIASWIVDIKAKRVAWFHSLFNIFSVFLALLFFYPFTSFILLLSETLLNLNPKAEVADIPMLLAFFHTGFNLFAIILAFPLLPVYERLLNKLGKETHKQKKELLHLRTRMFDTGELVLVQASSQLKAFTDDIKLSFAMINSLLMVKKEGKYSKVQMNFKKKLFSHQLQFNEIREFLMQISEHDLSRRSSAVFILLEEGNEALKSVSALIEDMAEIIESKNEENIWFSQAMRNDLIDAFSRIEEQFSYFKLWINYADTGNPIHINNIDNSAAETFARIRNNKNERLKDAEIPGQANVLFSQLIIQSETISGLLSNIIQSRLPL